MSNLKENGSADARVQFTIKELLGRIEGKIDALSVLVHDKADKADFGRLEFRVASIEKVAADRVEILALEKRILTLEKVAVERAELEEVEKRVNELEKDTVTKEAVEKNKEDLSRWSTKMNWVIIGIVVNTIGVVTALVGVFLNHPMK
jgi:tetrahydromethanopterin S-methyltransferase subunit G